MARPRVRLRRQPDGAVGQRHRHRIARRNTEHGSGLGVFRYVVEQTIALMHQFRRLRVRDDRDDGIHESFMTLACSVICWRRLHSATG